MTTPRRTAGRWCVVVSAVIASLTGAVAVGRAASLSVSSGSLTVVRTCELTAYPAATAVVADATVEENKPKHDIGPFPLEVRSASGANLRAFLRYDVGQCAPAIPSSASVKKATLRLLVTALPATCRTEDVFRVTGSWVESTIAWDNKPSTSASPTSSADLGLGSCANNTALTYVGWDVTADVQAFVAGTVTNNGWMIRDHNEGSILPQTAAFSSKNSGTSASVPVLTVTYMT